MMKKFLAIALALLILTGSVAVFAEAVPEETQAPQVSGEDLYTQLVIGSTTPLSGSFFTEMWGSNTSDIDVRMLLHGYSLVEWRSATGSYGVNESVVSGLAATDDEAGNRTYTLSLYDDLYYSDGTRITARDYAFAVLLSVAPEVAQIGGGTVDSEYIVGIDGYKAQETDVLSGVRVLNDTMLSITVKAEYRPFFYELALLNYSPYPIHVIAPGCEVVDTGAGVAIRNIPLEEGQEDNREPIFTAELLKETILNSETGYLSHPSVVSGPYQLTSFDWESRTAEFEINTHYKGNSLGQLPTIPKLIFCHVEPADMMEKLASGEVDLLHKCVSADVISAGMELTGSADISVSNYPRSGFSFMSFCCERNTVGSQAVRQAIAHCLDKEALTASYVGNYGIGVDGYYGVGQWVYELVNGTQAAPVEEPAENATAEELAQYEATVNAWDELSMDGLTVYDFDVDAAVSLLEQDGWTLNREGDAYDPEKDDVRCKEIDGQLTALELTMVYPAGNAIGEALQTTLIEPLAKAGILLTAQELAMTDLLNVYYRTQERDCDMIYLASNFGTVFDPAPAFAPEDAQSGASNRTGIADEELYQLAVDMRKTEPGDVLTYCQKWVAFQQRWTEVLPAIPVYSNVYFDFYDSTLQNYLVSGSQTWSQAVVGAYLSDVADEPDTGDDEMEVIE